MISIAIFASGSGSNAENLINYFRGHEKISVAAVYTNNSDAGVIKRCVNLDIPCYIYTNEDFREGNKIVSHLKSIQIEFIILAGFLRLITPPFLKEFPNKIINIHPALLPNYGGKGMYGMKVHETVILAKEKESGITIHLVNEHYDEGGILHQEKTSIQPTDTGETLAHKIHDLEYIYFPQVIEKYILSTL